jgi:CRP-like cAMP-binding protein
MTQTNHSTAGNATIVPGPGVLARSTPQRPRNLLLAALPRPTWTRLAPLVRHALLIPGQPLPEADSPTGRVYFPNSGLVSLTMASREGMQVEVGMIGREGTTGTVEMLFGSAPRPWALVQIAGNACWLPLSDLRAAFNSDADLRSWLVRYWATLGAQTAQNSLCNRLHSVEERLARWLLLARDRIGCDEIEITHEFIAHILGARRSGVTVALGALQQAGLIDCARGRITIRHAGQLASSSCECYAAVQGHFRQLECMERAAVENRYCDDFPAAYPAAAFF